MTHRSPLLVLAVAAAYVAASSLTFSWFGGNAVGATSFPGAGISVAALVLSHRRHRRQAVELERQRRGGAAFRRRRPATASWRR